MGGRQAQDNTACVVRQSVSADHLCLGQHSTSDPPPRRAAACKVCRLSVLPTSGEQAPATQLPSSDRSVSGEAAADASPTRRPALLRPDEHVTAVEVETRFRLATARWAPHPLREGDGPPARQGICRAPASKRARAPERTAAPGAERRESWRACPEQTRLATTPPAVVSG